MKKTIILFSMLLCAIVARGSEYSLTVGGKAQEVVAFKHYHYASFDMDKAVDVVLEIGKDVKSIEISPKSRNIESSLNGNTLRFRLDRAGYVMVRINDTDRLFLFAEKTEAIPTENFVSVDSYGVDNSGNKNSTKQIQKAINETAAKGKILLFPAGVYTSAMLRIPSNANLYLMRGAILQTDVSSAELYKSDDGIKTRKFLYIKDAKNVKITGLGIIRGNGAQMRSAFGESGRMRILMAINSSNLLLQGVMLQDPGSWNTQILLCHNVMIRNVKLMNDVDLSNTDGFDPDASTNLTIEDCFAYCGDDNVAIKTTGYSGYLGDVDSVTVRGCVFLTKKSSLKVGTETQGKVMHNILFENNDVLESDRAMSLYISDGALFENISYINNRIERNYPDAKRAGIHFVVNQRTPKSALGSMKNILIKDCTFERAFPKISEVKYGGTGNGIEVVIENLKIGGTVITSAQEANIRVENATVIFK